MKPTSTLPSNDGHSTSDEMYAIFVFELQARGVSYFNRLSTLSAITEGLLAGDTLELFIMRIALNPSLIAMFCEANPLGVLHNMVTENFNAKQTAYLNDFLDEISLNARLRNIELYDLRLRTIKEQILLSVRNNTRNDEKQMKVVEAALDRVSHNIVAYHYLRKIGYNSNDFRNIKEV